MENIKITELSDDELQVLLDTIEKEKENRKENKKDEAREKIEILINEALTLMMQYDIKVYVDIYDDKDDVIRYGNLLTDTLEVY